MRSSLLAPQRALRHLSTSACLHARRPSLPAKFAGLNLDTVHAPTLHASDELVDRKSRFLAHAAAVKTPEDIAAALDDLLDDKRIARATHPLMFAYRLKEEAGHDDGGEAGAGRVLLQLLESSGREGTLVVVTRWYGGSPLGSARFRHINTCAREALAHL